MAENGDNLEDISLGQTELDRLLSLPNTMGLREGQIAQARLDGLEAALLASGQKLTAQGRVNADNFFGLNEGVFKDFPKNLIQNGDFTKNPELTFLPGATPINWTLVGSPNLGTNTTGLPENATAAIQLIATVVDTGIQQSVTGISGSTDYLLSLWFYSGSSTSFIRVKVIEQPGGTTHTMDHNLWLAMWLRMGGPQVDALRINTASTTTSLDIQILMAGGAGSMQGFATKVMLVEGWSDYKYQKKLLDESYAPDWPTLPPPGGRGARGKRGSIGAPGQKGETGATGATGAAGVDAVTPAPIPGRRGDRGRIGPAGVQGETGAAGATGATGATGVDGVAAAPIPGRQGDRGRSGPTGQKGDTGDTGATGASGAAGAAGVDGPPGVPVRGRRGDRGRSGAPGLAGSAGPSGAAGAAGADGISIVGPRGRCGRKGHGFPGPAGADGAGSSNALLDGVKHTDTAAQTVTRGSIIIGNATPVWDELVIGAAQTVLRTEGAEPAWGKLVLSSDVDGLLGVANGGTGQFAYTKGDILVASAATTLLRQAVGSDRQVLTADSNQATGVAWQTPAAGSEKLRCMAFG